MLANGHGQQVTNGVVGLANQGVIDNAALLCPGMIHIVLPTEILYDLAGVERQVNLGIFQACAF